MAFNLMVLPLKLNRLKKQGKRLRQEKLQDLKLLINQLQKKEKKQMEKAKERVKEKVRLNESNEISSIDRFIY